MRSFLGSHQRDAFRVDLASIFQMLDNDSQALVAIGSVAKEQIESLAIGYFNGPTNTRDPWWTGSGDQVVFTIVGIKIHQDCRRQGFGTLLLAELIKVRA